MPTEPEWNKEMKQEYINRIKINYGILKAHNDQAEIIAFFLKEFETLEKKAFEDLDKIPVSKEDLEFVQKFKKELMKHG